LHCKLYGLKWGLIFTIYKFHWSVIRASVGVGYVVVLVESRHEKFFFPEELLVWTVVIEVILTDKECIGGGLGFAYPWKEPS